MTKFPYIRTRKSLNHIKGKIDIYYTIRYTINGKRKEEGVGWKSEGMTAEKAYKIRAGLLRDIENGYCISLKDRIFQNSNQRFFKENILKEMDSDMNTFFNEKYLPYVQTKNRKSTWIREKYLFDRWLSPSFGLSPMSQISRDSLVRVLNTMQKAGQSNRSQNYAISLTRQIFNYAIENDFFDGKNPASKYKFPKEDNRRERYLFDEEVNQILEALKKRSYNMYLMALMAADCGLRAGEVFNLTWADINFKNKTLFLKNTKNHKYDQPYQGKFSDVLTQYLENQGLKPILNTSKKTLSIE